jgi:tetratricopeptide (TPR) repeat protein
MCRRVAPSVPPSGPLSPLSPRTVWLGRDRELVDLEAGVEEILAGRGALFAVTGEPGIGKTRLADELGRSGVARGVRVHWGRAFEAGGAPSYWPFVQILRGMCQGLEPVAVVSLAGAHASALAQLVPELRPSLPALPNGSAIERFQLFEAVAALLRGLASRAPRLLVLDDLHATDPSTLLLLEFLARDLRSTALLVVALWRDAEARLAPQIGPLLARVAREATVLPLHRLDEGEVAEFVARWTGAAPSPDQVRALHQRTEGNPLFLHELLRTPSSGPSDGIREVVRQRLALLGAEVRRAIDAAAVLGRDFAVDPLLAVLRSGAAAPADDPVPLLMPAANAGVVEPTDQLGRWRFTHVLLRQAVYDALPPDRRQDLHRSAATELRRRIGGPPLAELAHHLLLAIPAVSPGEAADAAVAAAERAVEVLAFEDAIGLLRRAVAVLDGAPGEAERRFEVLLALGLARIRAADLEGGRDTCRHAAEIARRLGDGERFARAVLASVYEFVPGVRDEQVIALLEEVLAVLPPGDGALRARCLAQLAAERQPEPDPAPPIELARLAVEMARRVGDVDTLRFTLSLAGLAMLPFAAPSERVVVGEEALRLALVAGDRFAALRAHLFLQGAYSELGDRVAARTHTHAHHALLAEFRPGRLQWVRVALDAANALWEGRFDDGAAGLEEARTLSAADDSRGVTLLAAPAGLCRATERYDDLPAIEARLRASFGGLRQELLGCVGEMLLTQLYARAGDRDRTRALLGAVRAHPLFARITAPCWLALLVEPCHLLGDRPLAEHLYDVLRPHAGRFAWLGPLSAHFEPPYDRDLGLLCQTLGRLDDAAEHLCEAERRMVRAGMRSHLARVRYEIATVWIARGRADDRERAAALLGQARALAEELGLARLLAVLPPREPALAVDPAPRTDVAFSLRREGELWTLAAGQRTVRLRDSRGLQVLARLLASPGEEFHVLQLVGDGDGADPGDAGPVLDEHALRRYRGRLADLREDLEEAEQFADTGRAERAREEIAFLTREVAGAVGLGGRARRAGNAAERARTTVQKRLRHAIERIEQALPDVGLHLAHTIRTGTFCGYLPQGRRRGREA